MANAKSKRLHFDNGVIFTRKTKDGRTRYYIEFYNAQDKRKREVVKNAKNRRDAKCALEKRVQEENDIRYGIKRRPEKLSFNRLADLYEDWTKINKRSWASDVSRLKKMRAFLGNMLICQITSQDVEKFKKMRVKDGVKLNTVNRSVTILRRLFSLAMEWGFLRENPCRGVKKFPEEQFRRTRVLTREEEDKLLKAVKLEYLKSMIIVFLNTGLRRKELFNLKWSDVDFHNRNLYIRETKSSRSRYIPMNVTVYQELMRLHMIRKDDGIVYKNPNTRRSFVDIKKAFRSACSIADIKNLVLHDLRRTFATRLLESGCDIVTVQHLLGHRDINTTMIYTMTNQGEKRRAVSLLDRNNEAHLSRICPTGKEGHLPYHSKNMFISWN